MTNKNDQIDALVDGIKDHIEYGAGVITIKPEAITNAAHALGTTVEDIKRGQEASSNIGAAIIKAAGTMGIDNMKKDKNLNSVTSEFKVGHEKFKAVTNRSEEVSAGFGSSETKQVFGNTTISRTMTVNKTTFKSIRDTLAEYGGERLGKQ